MNPDLFCVIMAGGAGTRFWPISRSLHPKQFIDILGTGRTLLQQTFDRFTKICPTENIYIVTSAEYKEITLQQLDSITESQVLLEPARRNTAPCIAYANFRIQSINPNAKIIVAPSDHLIMNENVFIETIQKGVEFVSKEKSLLTLGIEPTRPDTGYGYIQINKEDSDRSIRIKKVKTFTEKPDIDLARFFVQSGEFYWNSGIFIWSIGAIQEAFATYLEDVYTAFHEKVEVFGTSLESKAVEEIYPACRNISIDYGVMEKAPNVFVLGSQFGWSDLGTWTSLFEHSPKTEANNALNGNILTYNTTDSVIKAPEGKLVVVQGLKDYVVIDTKDALLICDKKEEQQIRNFVNDIKVQKGEKFI
ncbi:MAG TPA: mannose-1-phosphate guanylyltransferase [Marinilabiliales bacterium]|nr:MAG: mannose-1-phosphate guanylyltransferase [Bacteroidetes bacterium GWA2_40_14]OFX62405.1 MAG: mannose-1-phosphate guanylyltransferase [Bacteroidetes bacterium GWC2_40_13]OFX73206.1 MAG: mannose-1-phosphate guanylyltransferase [Bacteroidetes bacterium GWD2_40_43]OFX92061.1 MAG: mannose-1-phosphate guanylyltransferase [Bacteroidetes bacterium GWE2_40_63]OFY16685.1 MAG: mannose-1-phosphate guanylyltransferase [Bacteroidetes bacterium GWF2_40_13]OFZ30581.1 MAG: mannose-1-phosphate guanylyltr